VLILRGFFSILTSADLQDLQVNIEDLGEVDIYSDYNNFSLNIKYSGTFSNIHPLYSFFSRDL